jgi:hypothetical protein
MAVDQVLLRAAEQCRHLALLTRTDAARQQLLRMADNFEATITPPQQAHEEADPVAPPAGGAERAASRDQRKAAA